MVTLSQETSISAYFGDLKDGTHKGDETDPRISVIEVFPEEIRYWMATKGALGRAIEAGIGAMTGRISAPGELRTITKSEVISTFLPKDPILTFPRFR